MALFPIKTYNLNSVKLLVCRRLYPILYSFLHENAEENFGALDHFTSKLVQNKTLKWEEQRILVKKQAILPAEFRNKHHVNINSIENLKIQSVNDLLEKAIDYDDYLTIVNLITQCIEYNKIPSLANLIQALSVCARWGAKNTIVEITKLCEKLRPELLIENSHFQHYIAEAFWVKGDVTKSLKLFEKVYKENVYLRRTIRSLLIHLIQNSENRHHSEATIVNLMQFSEMLVETYNDYSALGCMWELFIRSEWFVDQEKAYNILNNHPLMCKIITNKIPYVVRFSLNNHRTEVVYRLTEILLRHDMKSDISGVLLNLLNYWIQEGDFRQCGEIVSWAVENDISLLSISGNEKLIKLCETEISTTKEKLSVKNAEISKSTPTDYKF